MLYLCNLYILQNKNTLQKACACCDASKEPERPFWWLPCGLSLERPAGGVRKNLPGTVAHVPPSRQDTRRFCVSCLRVGSKPCSGTCWQGTLTESSHFPVTSGGAQLGLPVLSTCFCWPNKWPVSPADFISVG